MIFSLKILGSSSATPVPDRFSTAQVLNVLERFFLFDCGEGTQIQLRRFHIRTGKLNHVFISHLHGDHFLGIFGLISTLNMSGRKQPLHIYGPYKLQGLIQAYVDTMDHGLDYPLEFYPHNYNGKQPVFSDDKIMVESFPLRHRVPTCGFVVREKARLLNLRREMLDYYQIPIKAMPLLRQGMDYCTPEGNIISNNLITKPGASLRSYAFVSDTLKSNTIVPYIEGVDLLYHEATYADEGRLRAKQTGHSTARQAAEIALAAGVKKLIIGHFSNRYANLEPLLNEAREVFPETYLATDGSQFDIPLSEK